MKRKIVVRLSPELRAKHTGPLTMADEAARILAKIGSPYGAAASPTTSRAGATWADLAEPSPVKAARIVAKIRGGLSR